jgi:hypothetical protein
MISPGRFIPVSLLAYVPVSFAAAWMGASSIHAAFGLQVDLVKFWRLLIFPVGLPLMYFLV